MFFSLMPVEKPALGRGLDALMSGGKGAEGKKASDMLASFQGKRTRVGKGLGAFIKGGQGATGTPKPAGPQPTAPPAAPAATPKPMADLSSMRARRQPRSTPATGPRPAAMPNYRRARRPRQSTTLSPKPPPPEKSDPAPARLFVGSTNAPVAAKPFSAVAPISQPASQPEPESPQKPKTIRRKKPGPTPTAGAKPTGNPGFRMSLFVVDWFLLAMAFYVALNIEAGSSFALTLCVLAVFVGAVLGVWGLILKTEAVEE